MKDYIKPAVSLILSAISAEIIYIILLMLNIVHYYELPDWNDNIPAGCTITILFLLFNFLYGYIFRLNIKKCIIVQGIYLIISTVLMILFHNSENYFLVLCYPNIIIICWLDVLLYTKNIFVYAVLCITSVGLPVISSIAGTKVKLKHIQKHSWQNKKIVIYYLKIDNQTDDAEIKIRYAITESSCCWKWSIKRLIKWTAEGAVKGSAEYPATLWPALLGRRYDSILLKVCGKAINQGGTAECRFRPW